MNANKGGRGHKTALEKVLQLLSEGYTNSEIIQALNISKRRFYFLKRKLSLAKVFAPGISPENKGFTLQGGYRTEGLGSVGARLERWRLHRVQVRVPVLGWGQAWEALGGVRVQFGNTVYFKFSNLAGCTVSAYKKVLVCYLPRFRGLTVQECDNYLFSFIIKLLPILENVLKCKLVRPGSIGEVEVIKREYALEGALNAEIHVKRHDKVYVRDDLGRLRYLVDRSPGIPEFEAVNARLSNIDAEKFQVFYQDLLKNRWFLLQKGVIDIGDTVKELALVQARIVQVLKDRGLI